MSRRYDSLKIKSLLEICETGDLRLGKKHLDISELLGNTVSEVYRESDLKALSLDGLEVASEKCVFEVTDLGADETPFNYKDRLCILNFASSQNPGGGYRHGAIAQEECLCYASNLGVELEKHSDFYDYNITHRNKSLYAEGIIYSKNVVFFRNNSVNVEPVISDVITCAAPNRGSALDNGVSEEVITETLVNRLDYILRVAISHKNNILVLGAFGCGVFKNDPTVVSNSIKTLLKVKGYNKYFSKIIFAMKGKDNPNAKVFYRDWS